MATVITSYTERCVFGPERFTPVPFGGSERVRALICLEPGQFIPVHSPDVDVTFAILEGEGLLTAGEQLANVRPGSVAFVGAGESRGLRATTRLVALHVVTPPPTDADHAGVMAGIARGAWR